MVSLLYWAKTATKGGDNGGSDPRSYLIRHEWKGWYGNKIKHFIINYINMGIEDGSFVFLTLLIFELFVNIVL